MPLKIASRKEIPLPKFPEANCTTCPLNTQICAKPVHLNPNNGPKIGIRLMVIAESPGEKEIMQEEFFVGESGMILRETLKELGIDNDVWLDNVIPCDTRFMNSTYGKDTDEWYAIWDKAVENCIGRVKSNIQRLNPELIVILGDKAKSALMPNFNYGIMKASGTIVHDEDLKKDVLLNFHPASILYDGRGESNKLSMWTDNMHSIVEYFKGTNDIEVDVRIIDNQSKLDNMFLELEGVEELVLDLETTSFYPWDLGKGVLENGEEYDLGKIICMSLSPNDKTSYVVDGSLIRHNKAKLYTLLSSVKIINHNSFFDLAFIWFYIGKIFVSDDTMLMSYSMEETPFHSLKRLAKNYLRLDDWSVKLHPYLPTRASSFANVPKRVLYPYAGKDTVVPFMLREKLLPLMDSHSTKLYEQFLIPITNMFIGMTNRGIKVSPKSIVHSWWDLTRVQDKEAKFLKKEYGINNPNSSVQVAKAMRTYFDIDMESTGKKLLNSYLIDENYMETATDEEADLNDFARAVIGFRECNKGKNTYLRDTARSMSYVDFCVHPDYKLFASNTGRITINNPTFTNYTKGGFYAEAVRRPYKTRNGYIWFHADFKQCELRTYAVLGNDQRMHDILMSKDPKTGKYRDPHFEVGLAAYGKDFGEYNNKHFGRPRTIIKTFVFGRLYGRGAHAVARELDVELDEAERLCDIIDSLWDLQEYRDRITHELQTYGELVTPLGRKRRFPIIADRNWHRSFNQGCNFKIQGTATDLCLLTVMEIARVLEGYVFPLFTIHDSVEFEILEDKYDYCLPIMLDIFRNYPAQLLGSTSMNFEVDYKTAEHWMPF